ncbi:MAG TPA: cadmium-translocating P-type ATPase [Aquifex aeolicus]|nr:cadmium-translocating P-type ATPase [Aquifex aeolicus]
MKRNFKVYGMTCVNCARIIEVSLKKTKGVKKVNVSFELGEVEVEWNPSEISEEEIIRKIEELGYFVERRKDNYEKVFLVLSGISSLLVLATMFLKIPYHLEIQLFLSTLVQFTAGLKFYKGAYSSLKEGIGNMDTLVALGTTGAYLYSILAYLNFINTYPFFETNVFLITFVRLGKFIEEKAREKATEGLQNLFSISFKTVKVVKGDKEIEKNVREVFKGEKIACRGGDQILLDGKVVQGEALVNESVITGESLPILKRKGDTVYSGSIVEKGYIVVEVEKTFESSFINKIKNLVESTLREKPRIQQVSDKISQYFVGFVVIFSILTFLFWIVKVGDIQKAVQFSLAVLVVSCPCAFGIAVPLAVSVGIFKALKKGVLVKKSSIFEVFPKINTVIFDKTGTLTEGKFIVEKVEVKDENILGIVYSMEKFSNHPVAKALRNFLKDKVKGEVELSGCREILGVGVECGDYVVGKGEIWGIKSDNGYQIVGFGTKEKLLALFYLRDKIREEAREVIENLKRKGIEVILLTGDRKENAKELARMLGIDKVFAEVKPEEKLRIVEDLQKRGRKVCMVGDGVNDAPSLAKADIGVAILEGTDLAKISGDVIIHKLFSLVEIMEFSERVYRKIKENLFWAFVYNTLFIPVAAGVFHSYGLYLKPEFAGLLMALSSVSVVLNTLRILKS